MTRLILSLLFLIALLGCEAKTYTDSDRLAMYDLRGDWTSKSPSKLVTAQDDGFSRQGTEILKRPVKYLPHPVRAHILRFFGQSPAPISTSLALRKMDERVSLFSGGPRRICSWFERPAMGLVWTFQRTGF